MSTESFAMRSKYLCWLLPPSLAIIKLCSQFHLSVSVDNSLIPTTEETGLENPWAATLKNCCTRTEISGSEEDQEISQKIFFQATIL